MNPNKLFPRLPIRVKLAIAFVLIAGLPLALVTGVATRMQVNHLRGTAGASLDHELEIARTLMEEALREAEENVAYLAGSLLASGLQDPTPGRLAEIGERVASFLEHKSSLYQVTLIDADGTVLLSARASDHRTVHDDPPGNGRPSGMLYAYRAQYLEPGGHLLLPVELRGPEGESSAPIPAVAVVKPFWDPAGRFQGAMAGELYASALFAGLESESLRLPGVTGLVDQDGLFLYHSERKRDWATLLASREEVDLGGEFSPEVASRILDGEGGATTAEGRLVRFTPLSLGNYGTGPLFLYRATPLSALEGPVQGFLWRMGFAGLGLGTVVLGLAAVAANQFTRPIYRLREGMRRLAAGEDPSDTLAIETNDELEDLAGEFTKMAISLSDYRLRLEELVAERTRALHETYAELANVLAHSADAIIGLDPDGRVRVWNRGAEVLFGYRQAEAVARNVDSLIHPRSEKPEPEAAFLTRKLEERGAVVDFRTKRVRKDGDLVPVSLTQSVIRDEKGELLGYSLILRDASMQAKLEEQMRRSERLAAVSLMGTSLAHEVKNPLAILGNRIEVMQREVRSRCLDCKLDGDLSVLREQTTRLSEVTRALLDLASQEEDAGVGRVNLPELVERMVRLTEPLFTARELCLEIRAPQGSVPEVNGNEKALETVCLNLLLNAADETPPGGTVALETRAATHGPEVDIEVRDTGAGIPPALHGRIFEPFFTTKGPRGGTGLGLAVCRSVVERHGGRIRVESEVGEGSRFIVTLPVRGSVTL